MKELSRIQVSDLPELHQPNSAELSLTARSGLQLPDAQVEMLGTWMAEVHARYPNQTLLLGTPDMWLREWERMVLRFGITTFRAALSKAIQGSKFFPPPEDIEEICRQVSDEERGKRVLEKLNAEFLHLEQHRDEYVRVSEVFKEAQEKVAARKAEHPSVAPEETRPAQRMHVSDEEWEAKQQRVRAQRRAAGITDEMVEEAGRPVRELIEAAKRAQG